MSKRPGGLNAPPPDLGLPCSRAGVAAVLAEEATRSRSTGNTVREGFIFLANVAGIPFDVSSSLLEAAAAHPDLGAADTARPVRHAASMPLGIQCQLESLAAGATPSVVRTVSRCLLVASLLQHVRLNDALNAKLCVGDGGIIAGVTTVRSKTRSTAPDFRARRGLARPAELVARARQRHDVAQACDP